MKLWLLLFALPLACLQAGEPKFFRGTSTDSDWPHRYVIEVLEDEVAIHVEQLVDPLDDEGGWFSWGSWVKTHKVAKDKISFSCPWGVIGKALQVACTLKFEDLRKEGFEATITIDSFLEDNARHLRFTRIDQKDLAPIIAVLIKQAEQGGADQPATAPKSKSEGKEKLKPESEGRSQ